MRRRDFMKSMASVSAVAAGASALSGVANAASGNVSTLNDQWHIRGSESFSFKSKHVGDDLAVGVWQPNTAMPDQFKSKEELQIVYVLDASFLFGTATTIALSQQIDMIKPGSSPLLVVGIDYLESKPNARTRDYTHTDLATPFTSEKLPPEQTIGGADNFLRFLEDELDPFIRSKYNVSDKPAGILGDSYGGTFTFHAFRRQSKLFDKYWLGSPGLSTTGVDYIGEIKKVLSGNLVHNTKMYLSLGELESNGGVALYEEIGRNYDSLISVLNSTPNEQLTWHGKIYPGHTHTSILMPAMNDAMFYLFGSHFPQA